MKKDKEIRKIVGYTNVNWSSELRFYKIDENKHQVEIPYIQDHPDFHHGITKAVMLTIQEVGREELKNFKNIKEMTSGFFVEKK